MLEAVPSEDVVEFLPEPAILTSEQGRIVAANRAFCQLAGLSHTECEDANLFNLCSSGTEGLSALFERAARTRQIQKASIGLQGKNRATQFFEAEAGQIARDDTGCPVFMVRFWNVSGQRLEASGAVLRWLSTCADVEGLRRAEEAQAWLAAIVESSDDAILSKTLDGIITSWNRGAERIFGYKAEEVIGKSITILIPPNLVDEETDILRRLRQGRRIEHYETTRLRKDGRAIDLSLSISPVRDRHNRIVGASKIARDITQRKEAERALAETKAQLQAYAGDLERRVLERTAKLQETVRSLDGFCYTLAHDLRAPVRAMIGFSAELSEQYGATLDETGRDYLARIKTAAQRMDRLILDLLEYGRLDTLEVPTVPIDLADIVQRALLPFEADIKSRSARINLAVPLHRVTANPIVLEQIFSNLIGNALKFTRPGTVPEVAISSEDRGDVIRVWVRDNGIGIKASHLGKLFQPFSRLVNGTEYPGTGMGLAIVRKAAQRMGGRVGIESEYGKGSGFWVELPSGRSP